VQRQVLEPELQALPQRAVVQSVGSVQPLHWPEAVQTDSVAEQSVTASHSRQKPEWQA